MSDLFIWSFSALKVSLVHYVLVFFTVQQMERRQQQRQFPMYQSRWKDVTFGWSNNQTVGFGDQRSLQSELITLFLRMAVLEPVCTSWSHRILF